MCRRHMTIFKTEIPQRRLIEENRNRIEFATRFWIFIIFHQLVSSAKIQIACVKRLHRKAIVHFDPSRKYIRNGMLRDKLLTFPASGRITGIFNRKIFHCLHRAKVRKSIFNTFAEKVILFCLKIQHLQVILNPPLNCNLQSE